jgi:hypothetical protein
MILRVALEVLGKLVDALGKQRDLHVGAAGIFFVEAQACDLGGFNLSHFFRFWTVRDTATTRAGWQE